MVPALVWFDYLMARMLQASAGKTRAAQGTLARARA
jgi:hypothetical protein